MCGIAGIYGINGVAEPSWIRDMASILRHRGPDNGGFIAADPPARPYAYSEPVHGSVPPSRLFLGHRRLSIIDLSANAHQPMGSADGHIWITYNGEIYNYKELRSELERSGKVFRTGTDTEVLLAAYEAWGFDCLEKLNGMWAFVIYDARKNILFGSRDRFGVKPFYYIHDKSYFAFASEIKALAALPFYRKKINEGVLFDYLVMSVEETDEEGVFKGIYELKPSTAFIYDLGKDEFKKWRYFSLPFTDQAEVFDPGRSVGHASRCRELVYNAVKLRLRSDVPVGSCLSGGLDSSSIVCVINDLLREGGIPQVGDRLKVFTACFEKSGIDESGWAGKVVDATKASWFKAFPDNAGLLRDLEDIVYSQDIPFGSTSIYAQYCVMRLASGSGIKVLLDGQGGDEMFSGYGDYYGAFFAEMLKGLSLRQSLAELGSLGNSPIGMRSLSVQLLKIAASKTLPSRLFQAAYSLKSGHEKYLNRDFLLRNGVRKGYAQERKAASLNKALLNSMTGPGLKSLLRYEDRNSMRFSIEARVPFADDKDLIDYAFTVPSSYKIHNGWSKYVLRESMKGTIPDQIRERRDKVGFATPENIWLGMIRSELKDYFTKDLDEFLDTGKVLKDWDRLMSQPGNSRDLWRMINLAVWKKVYSI